MRKILDSLFGIVSDAVHPREVGVAVLLGTLAGFVTGWNLTLLAVLALVLVLRAPLKVFAEAWGLALGLSWALTPLTFRTGKYVLEQSNFGGWIAARADGIWVVLFDLDRYTLVGGIACGLVIASAAAVGAFFLTRWLQTRFQKFQDLVSADGSWKAPLAVRVAYWMIFGSPAQARPASEPRLIRKAGVAVAAVVILPAAGLVWYFGPGLVERSVLNTLAAANGAEVNGSVELSLGEGLLLADGLQVADPDALDYDRLRVNRLTAVVKPGPLLRGQVIVEKVLLEGISFGEPRARRARRVGLELPSFGDVAPQPEGDENGMTYGQPGTQFPLKDYAADWQQWQQRLERVQWLLEKVERFGSDETHADEADRIPTGYLAMHAARCDFGRQRPRVQIGLLRARDLPQPWGLGHNALIQISDLSSDPKLGGRPTNLELRAPQHGLQVAARLNLHRSGAPHAVSLEARGVDLQKLVNTSKLGQELRFDGGSLDLLGSGWITSRSLEVPLRIVVRDVRIEAAADRKLAGLTPDLWNHGLAQLRGFDIKGSLQGHWTRPQLQLDSRDLANQFKQQLAAAGNLVIAQAVDEQIARGRQAVEGALAEGVADARGAVQRGRESVDDAVAQGHQQLSETDRYVEGRFDAAQQRVDEVRATADRYAAQGAERLQEEIQRHSDGAGGFFGETGPAAAAGDMLPPGMAQQIINETSRQAQGRVEQAQDEVDRYADSAAERIQAGIDAARRRYEQTGNATEDNSHVFQQPLVGAEQHAEEWLENTRRTAGHYGESIADQSLDQPSSAAHSSGAAQLGAADARHGLPPQAESGGVRQGAHATPMEPIYVPQQRVADRYAESAPEEQAYVPTPPASTGRAALDSRYQPADPQDRSVLPPTDRLSSQYEGARRETSLYDSDWSNSASATVSDSNWQQDSPSLPAEVPAGGVAGGDLTGVAPQGGIPYPETTPRGTPAGFTERPDDVRLPAQPGTVPRSAPPMHAAPPLPAGRPGAQPPADTEAESDWTLVRWGKQMGSRVKRIWPWNDEQEQDSVAAGQQAAGQTDPRGPLTQRPASGGLFGSAPPRTPAAPQHTAAPPQRTANAQPAGGVPPGGQAPPDAAGSQPEEERWYQKLQFWR